MNGTIFQRPRFLLFGDSLTERSLSGQGGWGASLAHTYFRKVDVVNRGFGGYNTRWALHILDRVFDGADADNTLLVTLFFGANDAARPDGTPHSARQHIPLPEYKDNMRKMVAHIRGKGISRIVLLNAPPIYEPGRKEWQVQRMGAAEAASMAIDRTNNFTRDYAEACKEVAKELNVPVVDLWTRVQQEEGWGTKLLCDGLHFTPEGNQLVYKELQHAINATYPEIKFDVLPTHFPAWDAINPEDPASSLT